jgi:hypothetical protein
MHRPCIPEASLASPRPKQSIEFLGLGLKVRKYEKELTFRMCTFIASSELTEMFVCGKVAC